MNIIIIGAGCQGLVVSDIINNMKETTRGINILGYLDDNYADKGKMVGQYKVIGCLKDLKKIKYDKVIVAIGDNKKRKMITDKLKVKYFTAVHPSAVISKAAKISDGCMILGGVIVNAGAYVGRHTILNTGCTIDHHNNIGCFAHIAPGVHLGGNVKIGEGTLVGIGATVINNINIGKWSVVGAGAVVVRNIGGQIITYGTPAKFIRNIDKI